MQGMAAILDRYDIGQVDETIEINSGLMHSTYLVSASSGRFTLQRLHKKLATAEIIGDYEAVTTYLAMKNMLSPRLMRTSDDHPIVTDDEGRWWRLATWIDGETRDKVTSVNEAEQGARALGRFHRAMADFDHVFASQHPLHDTEAHLAGLRAALTVPGYTDHRESIGREIEQILEMLPRLLLPHELPQRVVHGDPKISNVLYRGSEAVGMIDLDTCNRHTLLVDLGDAVRSWCRDGSEDEEQHFRLDRFEAIIRGYAAEGPALDTIECAYLGGAGRLITLELASRFARDVMEDEYFAYDATRYPSRRAHNQARTRAMLFLANDMKCHRSEIDDIVHRYLGPF
jgi:Ser/Thr protein kinase RdoA (MazF antagonist)